MRLLSSLSLWLCLQTAFLPAQTPRSDQSRIQIQQVQLEAAPTPGPNLVANYSFEQAQASGQPADWVWDKRNTDAMAVLDDSTAHSGRQSLRFTNGTPFGAHVYGLLRAARPIQLKPGASYTLSCFVKSDDPGLAWIGGGHNWRLRLHFTSTHGSWQRFSTTFVPSTEVNGQKIVNLVNYNQEPQEVELRADGKTVAGDNLLEVRPWSGTSLLQPLQPALIRLP